MIVACLSTQTPVGVVEVGDIVTVVRVAGEHDGGPA